MTNLKLPLVPLRLWTKISTKTTCQSKEKPGKLQKRAQFLKQIQNNYHLKNTEKIYYLKNIFVKIAKNTLKIKAVREDSYYQVPEQIAAKSEGKESSNALVWGGYCQLAPWSLATFFLIGEVGNLPPLQSGLALTRGLEDRRKTISLSLLIET